MANTTSTQPTTTVLICAISANYLETRYVFDACRWVQLLEAKGVPLERIHLYGSNFGQEAKSVLSNAITKKPALTEVFSLLPEHIEKYYSTCYKGDSDKFLAHLKSIAGDQTTKCLTVILINHGDGEGTFGNSKNNFYQSQLFDALTVQTVPTVVICSACYAKVICYSLGAHHRGNNILRIYDNGNQDSLTYNWGVSIEEKADPIEFGTRLCYWLFDAIYTSIENYDIMMAFRHLHNKPKPDAVNPDCTVILEGDSILLKNNDFFGPNKPSKKLVQPPIAQTVKVSFSFQKPAARPHVSAELNTLVDNFLQALPDNSKYSEFWDFVYDSTKLDIVLQQSGAFDKAVKIYRLLKSRQLVTTTYNGASIPYILVYFQLDEKFIVFLGEQTKTQ